MSAVTEKWRLLLRDCRFKNRTTELQRIDIRHINIHELLRGVKNDTADDDDKQVPEARAAMNDWREASKKLRLEYFRHSGEGSAKELSENGLAHMNSNDISNLGPVLKYVNVLKNTEQDAGVEARRVAARSNILSHLVKGLGKFKYKLPDFKDLYHTTVESVTNQLISIPQFMAGGHSDVNVGSASHDLTLVLQSAAAYSANDFNSFKKIANDIQQHRILYEMTVEVFTTLTAMIESSITGLDETDQSYHIALAMMDTRKLTDGHHVTERNLEYLGLMTKPNLFNSPFEFQSQKGSKFHSNVIKLYDIFLRMNPDTKPTEGRVPITLTGILGLCARVSEYLVRPRPHAPIGASKVVYCTYPDSSDIRFLLNHPRESLAKNSKTATRDFIDATFLQQMDSYVSSRGCNFSAELEPVLPFLQYGFPTHAKHLREEFDKYERRNNLSEELQTLINKITTGAALSKAAIPYDKLFDAVRTSADARFLEYLSDPIQTNNWTGKPDVPLSRCIGAVEEAFGDDADEPNQNLLQLAPEICGMRTKFYACGDNSPALDKQACKLNSYASTNPDELKTEMFSADKGCAPTLCELIMGDEDAQFKQKSLRKEEIVTGMRVRLRLLEKQQDYNGKSGVVVDSVAKEGRFNVKLDAGNIVSVHPEHMFEHTMCNHEVLSVLRRNKSQRKTIQKYRQEMTDVARGVNQKDKTCVDMIKDNCVGADGRLQENLSECEDIMQRIDDNDAKLKGEYNCEIKKGSMNSTPCEFLKYLLTKTRQTEEQKTYVTETMNKIGCNADMQVGTFIRESSANIDRLSEHWEAYVKATNGKFQISNAQIETYVLGVCQQLSLLNKHMTDLERYQKNHGGKFAAFIDSLIALLEANDRYYREKRFRDDSEDDGEQSALDVEGWSLESRMPNYMMSVVWSQIYEEYMRAGETRIPLAHVVLLECMKKKVKHFEKYMIKEITNSQGDLLDRDAIAHLLLTNTYLPVSLETGTKTFYEIADASVRLELQNVQKVFGDGSLSYPVDLASYTLPEMLGNALGTQGNATEDEENLIFAMFTLQKPQQVWQSEVNNKFDICLRNLLSSEMDLRPVLEFFNRCYFYSQYLGSFREKKQSMKEAVQENFGDALLGYLQRVVGEMSTNSEKNLDKLQAFHQNVLGKTLETSMTSNDVAYKYYQAVSQLMQYVDEEPMKEKFHTAHLLLLEASFTYTAITASRPRTSAPQAKRKFPQANPRNLAPQTRYRASFLDGFKNIFAGSDSTTGKIPYAMKRTKKSGRQSMYVQYLKDAQDPKLTNKAKHSLLNIDYSKKNLVRPTVEYALATKVILRFARCVYLMRPYADVPNDLLTTVETHGDALFLFELATIAEELKNPYKMFDAAFKFRVLTSKNQYNETSDSQNTHINSDLLHAISLELDFTRQRYYTDPGIVADEFFHRSAQQLLETGKEAACQKINTPYVKCHPKDVDGFKGNYVNGDVSGSE